MMDILRNLFGGAPQPAAAAPAAPMMAVPGGGNLSPEVLSVLQQFGFQPPDPADDRRRAIASALARGGQSLASSKQDFLPALGGAVGDASVGYTEERNTQAEAKRKNNLDILKQMFGLEKLDQNLETRMAIEGMRNEDRDARTKIALDSLNHRITDANIRAGETNRHNIATEGLGGRNATTAEKNADTARINAVKPPAGRAGAKDNYFLDSQRAEAAKANKAKALGLDKDAEVFKIMDPEGYAKAQKSLEEFSAEVDSRLKQKYDGAQTKAEPIPQPAETKGKVDVTDLNLPGDIAARVVKRITKNGKTYVKLDDGKVYEAIPE